MKVRLANGETREISRDKATIESVMQDLGISSQDYVAVCNGKVVPEDDLLSDGDELKLIRIAHGG